MLVLFQSVLEDLASQDVHLSRLREKAQLLWDEHAAGKGFMHHVSQLSAQYLALTNLTKVRYRPAPLSRLRPMFAKSSCLVCLLVSCSLSVFISVVFKDQK
jgi:hypothetical protein